MTRWLACLIGCAACHGEITSPAAADRVRTATLQRGDVIDRQLMTGELRAATSLGLTVPRTDSWQLTIRWLAEDGALVKTGDKMLEFDNSEFTAQLAEKHLAVLEAEMALHAMQDLSAIETATRTTVVRQRQLALDKAAVRAGVPADLLAGREAQERQLEKKRAEVALDKAVHELAAQRDQAALELRIKQIELDKVRRAVGAAETTIAELVLTAPRDGMIVVESHPWLGRKIRIGDTVQPGMTLVSLPDMTLPMEVRAELSDADDGRVEVGMTGRCTLDAYPGDPVPCTVKDVTPVARSKGESSLRRAFAVTLDLARTDSTRMRPGISVKVELHPRMLPGVVVVPRGAVVDEPSRPDKHARVRMASGELREVTLGLCDAQACAAEAGLAAGEVVAIAAPGGPS